VTEVFDWDAAALLRGSHQKRLGVPADERPAVSPVPETGAAPATLDTPLSEVGKPAKRKGSTKRLSDWQ